MTVQPFSLESVALKPRDIAARLGVERSTVYRWIKSGELPTITVAGAKYVLAPAYERFVERYQKRATIEEQAARYIGEGEEVEGTVPVPRLRTRAEHELTREGPSTGLPADELREQLRRQLATFEQRFNVSSEHVHRVYVVERQRHIAGIPDEIVPQWAGCYAAYAELALVLAR